MTPGHSMKGRKCLLKDNDDVAEMYSGVYRQASYCFEVLSAPWTRYQ